MHRILDNSIGGLVIFLDVIMVCGYARDTHVT